MPRMPKYLKEEWAFFLDERGRKKYNELCRKCERSCKQSFRATVIHCPHYLSKRRTRQKCFILAYENEARYPGEVIKLKSFEVQGVARHVIKAL